MCDQYEAIDILDNNDTDIEGITLHRLGIKSWSKRWKRYKNKDEKWGFKFFRSQKNLTFYPAVISRVILLLMNFNYISVNLLEVKQK